MQRYNFTIEGTTGDNNAYTTSGVVEGEILGCFESAMRLSFQQLTGGKAVFGNPGAGCRGPYKVTKMVLEVVKQ